MSAWADESTDALRQLQRMYTASRTLTYSGVYVHQSDSQTETTRITHLVKDGRELERLEMLDGSHREVIREDNEVKCYLPESNLLVLERRNSHSGFPALRSEGMERLTDYYEIRAGLPERIAGLVTRSVRMDARDEFRYGRQFWMDARSGLMLKTRLHDRHDETPLESFSFTEIRIGTPTFPETFKPRAMPKGGSWKIHDLRAIETEIDDGAWVFRNRLPGFYKVSRMKRSPRTDAPGGTQVVFSDGIAAISVFIEPLIAGGPRPETGMFTLGAISIYKRLVDEVLLVVMGDVPPVALKKLGDGIEAARH